MNIDRRELLQILAAAPALAQSKAAPQSRPLLARLCQLIIPADEHVGGAVEGGVPEFIELLAGENVEYQRQVSGGLLWVDSACHGRYGKSFLESTTLQQTQFLDLIAFRESAKQDPTLLPGIQFFAFLRELTLDGFFTSRIGIEYLGYHGNSALAQFPGCPKPE